MSYTVTQPPSASTGAQTTSTDFPSDSYAPTASYGPTTTSIDVGGGGGQLSPFQSPQISIGTQQPSQPQFTVPGLVKQPGQSQMPWVPVPDRPRSTPGAEAPLPWSKLAKPFWVQTRFGGRAWTDDLLYSDYGVATTKAAYHAKQKPESERDFIRVGQGDAYLCQYVVGNDGNWTSDCPGAPAGGDEAMGYGTVGFGEDTSTAWDWAAKLWTTATQPQASGGGVPAVAGPTSSSSDIKAWQAYLNTKGCKLAVDGIWGPLTAAATVAVQAGKPCPIGASSGGTYIPPSQPVPQYQPPSTLGGKSDTIMGFPKAAVYVGAGSLVLLGAAIFMTRKKKPASKQPLSPVVAKPNCGCTANV